MYVFMQPSYGQLWTITFLRVRLLLGLVGVVLLTVEGKDDNDGIGVGKMDDGSAGFSAEQFPTENLVLNVGC